ncbi:MAG: hypothetical protein ACR2QS_17430 [Woeseiaceae bacterium]
MRTKFQAVALAVFGIIFIAACATPTEVVKLYDSPTRPAQTYKRLFVVDVSRTQDQLVDFEKEITARLKQESVDGVPSYTLIESGAGVLQDDIYRASDEVGADGILVAHIASVDTTMDVEEGRDEMRFECRGGSPIDYFLYDHEVLSSPDAIKLAHTVVVVTNLYDAESRERVWTIQSTCFEKASMREVLLEEANAIVRQLLIDKLI